MITGWISIKAECSHAPKHMENYYVSILTSVVFAGHLLLKLLGDILVIFLKQ